MEGISDIFSELKVLDISSVLAGPLTGSFLAEMGCQVTKIENKKTKGDATRQWKLPTEKHTKTISAYYASANYKKSVILLDYTDKEDYSTLKKLVVEADIVISNFQKRVAEKLKVTYEDLAAINDKIVFAQLNAYTYDDPRPGYDLVMQAEAGWISMTGTDGDHLAKMPVAMIDIIASHQMRSGILAGLLKREMKGVGSCINVSLYQSAISALANQASNWLMNNHIPQPIGTLHPNIAPYGDIFISKDQKHVILAVGSDIQFEKLGKTLNLAADWIATFINNKERVSNRTQISDAIQQKIEQCDLSYIVQILSDANVPFCIVKNLQEVFENNLAKNMVREEIVEGVPTLKVSSIAFTIR